MVAEAAYNALMYLEHQISTGTVRNIRNIHYVNVDAESTSTFTEVFSNAQAGHRSQVTGGILSSERAVVNWSTAVAALDGSDLKKADFQKQADSRDVQQLSNAMQKQKTSQSGVQADQEWWRAGTGGHQSTMDPNAALQSVLPTSSVNSTTVNRCETVIPKSSDPYRIVTPSGIAVQIYQGNLLDEKVDAIVNPANTELTHGGGAARAIAEAAGRQLQEECRAYISEHKELKVTQAMHTTAGNLNPPVIYVIHVAGPLAAQFHNSDSLYQAVFDTFKHCLLYANNFLCVSSLSVPAISSGEYIAVF